ncbi:uncharacterized protein ACOB8E_000358 [Sarcophilus harrisii]
MTPTMCTAPQPCQTPRSWGADPGDHPPRSCGKLGQIWGFQGVGNLREAVPDRPLPTPGPQAPSSGPHSRAASKVPTEADAPSATCCLFPQSRPRKPPNMAPTWLGPGLPQAGSVPALQDAGGGGASLLPLENPGGVKALGEAGGSLEGSTTRGWPWSSFLRSLFPKFFPRLRGPLRDGGSSRKVYRLRGALGEQHPARPEIGACEACRGGPVGHGDPPAEPAAFLLSRDS